MNSYMRYMYLFLASIGCSVSAKSPAEHRAKLFDIVSHKLAEVNSRRSPQATYNNVSDIYSKALAVIGDEKIQLNKQLREIANALVEEVVPGERVEMDRLLADHNGTPPAFIGTEGFDVGVRLGEKMTSSEEFIAKVVYYSLYTIKYKKRLGNSLFALHRYLSTAGRALVPLFAVLACAAVISHGVAPDGSSVTRTLQLSATSSLSAIALMGVLLGAADSAAQWYTKDIDRVTDEEVINLGFGSELTSLLEAALEEGKNYYGYYDTTWGWFCSLFRDILTDRIKKIRQKTEEVSPVITEGVSL